MALSIQLQEIANKSAGVYQLVINNTARARVTPPTTLRLVPLNSRRGPVNSLVYINEQDYAGLESVFGGISSRDERHGNFGIRIARHCLENGPIVVMNLRRFDDTLDKAGLIGMSAVFGKENTDIQKEAYSKLHNTERLWYPDPEQLGYLNATKEAGISFANVGSKKLSIFVRKSTAQGWNMTVKEWYTKKGMEVPEYVAPYAKMIDTFIDVFVFETDFSNAKLNMANENYGYLFTDEGIKAFYTDDQGVDHDPLNELAQIEDAQFVRKYTGSLIDNLVDAANNVASITGLVNAYAPTDGLMMYVNPLVIQADEILDYDPEISGAKRPFGIDFLGMSRFRLADEFAAIQDRVLIEGEAPVEPATDMIFESYTGAGDNQFDKPFGGMTYQHAGVASVQGITNANKLTIEYTGAIHQLRLEDSRHDSAHVIWFDPTQKRHFVTVDGTEIPAIGNRTKISINLAAVGMTGVTKVEVHTGAGNNPTEEKITIHSLALEYDKALAGPNIDNVLDESRTFLWNVGAGSLGNVSAQGSMSIEYSIDRQEIALKTFGQGGWLEANEIAGNINYDNYSDYDVIILAKAEVSGNTLGISLNANQGSETYNQAHFATLDTGYKFYNLGKVSEFTKKNGAISVVARDMVGKMVYLKDVLLTTNPDLYLNQNYSITEEPATVIVASEDKGIDWSGKTEYPTAAWLSHLAQNCVYATAKTTINYSGTETSVTIEKSDVAGKQVGGRKITCWVNPDLKGVTEAYVLDEPRIKTGDYLIGNTSNLVSVQEALAVGTIVDTASGVAYNVLKITANEPVMFAESLANLVNKTRKNITLSDGTVLENVVETSLYTVYDLNAPLEGESLAPITLVAYTPRSEQFCDGTAARQKDILNLINEPSFIKGLKVLNEYRFRYVIDPFKTYIEPQAKANLAAFADTLNCRVITSTPFTDSFRRSTNPYFRKTPSTPLEAAYIEKGGNKDLVSSNTFSLPVDGADKIWFFGPGMKNNATGKEVIVPFTGAVGKAFLNKFLDGTMQPYYICANQAGILSVDGMVGTENEWTDDERDCLERMGYNPIITQPNIGVTIYGNQTASQRVLSDLSKIHISELVLTIQEEMRKMLKNYVFKYNNYQYRLEIYTKAEEIMKQIFSNGGVYWWQNVIDTTNNTLEVINNSMGILDTHIVATKGGEKWVHRTYLETGANISGFETMM